MDKSFLERKVRSALWNILQEQTEETDKGNKVQAPKPVAQKPEEKPKKKAPKRRKNKRGTKGPPGSVGIASGAFGTGGRFKSATTEAGARAMSDPKGLMKDLGVKVTSGNDLEQVLGVMNAAIHSNDIMGQAYSGATLTQEQAPDGTLVNVVGITNAGLDHRNAIKFLSHTLLGAKNAGMLNLVKAVEINKGRNAPIIVYVV